jgi:ABC-type methionine transport system permease subunit
VAQHCSQRVLAAGRAGIRGITLFRRDIDVRDSAVLGRVGAGGIGMAIDTAMNLFQWERVALMLVAIVYRGRRGRARGHRRAQAAYLNSR